MKTFPFFLTLLTTPVLVGSISHAETAPATINQYIPCDGTLLRGAVVRLVLDESFAKLHQGVIEKLQQLPENKRKEITDSTPANTVLAYTTDIWPNKADYDAYLEAWKKVQIAPVADVGMGFQSAGDGTWRVLAITRTPQGTMPMTIANLRYNAKTNTWLSNNGELTPKEYTADNGCAYGAQTGTEWILNKEDSLSKLTETVRFSKTTDGKYVYILYSLVENSAFSGAPVANHGYILRFDVPTARANTGKPGQK